MFKPNLVMQRKDVVIDHKQVKCKNASVSGFSTRTLRPGMFFAYFKDGRTRIGRMHHRLDYTLSSQDNLRDMIVAQVAHGLFWGYISERWVDPLDVIETQPIEQVEPEIVALFERFAEELQ